MAFKLTRTGSGIWEGKIGEDVTLDVRSANPAMAVRIAYAGTEDGVPPLEFTIVKGLAAALVIAVAVRDGQEVEIHEVDGENSQHLQTFFWSKLSFFDFISVRGV